MPSQPYLFWQGVFENWIRWWRNMWPLLRMPSCMVQSLESQQQRKYPQWRNPPGCWPLKRYHRGSIPNGGSYWDAGPWRGNHGGNIPHGGAYQDVPVELSSKEVTPTREPTKELTTPIATDTKPMGRCHTPHVQCKKKDEREGQQVHFPVWTKVLYPAQPVTCMGWTSPTLSKLRCWSHSQSAGGRRAQCWRAEGWRQAILEESESASPPGPSEPEPEIAPPPSFMGVMACLWRDSSPVATIEAPWKSNSQIYW